MPKTSVNEPILKSEQRYQYTESHINGATKSDISRCQCQTYHKKISITSNHKDKKCHNEINVEILIQACTCSCRYGLTISKEQPVDNDGSYLP